MAILAVAFEVAAKLIDEWRPGELPTELKYRDSLAAFFRDRLKDKATVETEYRHAGTTIDIYLKKPGIFGATGVFIELKRNLTSKSNLDRLVGQIESLQPSKNCIIVLLCGNTNPALVMRLKEKYKDVLWNGLLGTVQIILKDPAKDAKS